MGSNVAARRNAIAIPMYSSQPQAGAENLCFPEKNGGFVAQGDTADAELYVQTSKVRLTVCSRLRGHHFADELTKIPVFPTGRAVLLLTGVTDHGQMGDRHMTALDRVFIHAVLFHLLFRIFLHTMHCGI